MTPKHQGSPLHRRNPQELTVADKLRGCWNKCHSLITVWLHVINYLLGICTKRWWWWKHGCPWLHVSWCGIYLKFLKQGRKQKHKPRIGSTATPDQNWTNWYEFAKTLSLLHQNKSYNMKSHQANIVHKTVPVLRSVAIKFNLFMTDYAHYKMIR